MKFFNFKKLFAWLYVIIWCGLIFFLSSIPNLKIKNLAFLDLILRKTAHFFEYFILVLLFIRAFKITYFNIFLNKKTKFYFLSTILSLLYAISDEIHQYFVPTRNFSLTDILIDFLGICFGVIFWDIKLENKKLIL